MSSGVRKRPSNARLESAGVGSGGSDDGRGGAGQGRLAAWQAICLTLVAIVALWQVLGATSPRARAAQALLGHALPKCFPLSDNEVAMLLGPDGGRAYTRRIACASERARVFFSLGMLAAHGFNQMEAASMFQACLRVEPTCAMCSWGLSYSEGPIPNKVAGAKLSELRRFPTFSKVHATDALTRIQAAARANAAALAKPNGLDAALVARERAWIEAMAERFAKGAAALKAERWRDHEAGFAQRMQELAEEHQDADAFALAAEALMNLSPWDYYDGGGQLRPNAATAEALLLKALALQPRHTHALHLHIHIAEAAAPGPPSSSGQDSSAGVPLASRALGSAEALASMSPENGHLIHMPSHIFVRVGLYARAVEVNKAAYEFDIERGSKCRVPYLPEHNANMLVFAASMAGMFHTAEGFAKAMRTLRERVPDTWMASGSEWVSLPTVWARYGAWPELLRMPPPPVGSRGVTSLGGPEYAHVLHRATRVLALSARAAAAARQLMQLDDVAAFDLARKSLAAREKEVAHEHKLLQAAVRAVPVEPPTRPGAPPGMYASAYRSLAAMWGRVAEARVALLHNNTGAAAEALHTAVAVEDGLGYMEPHRVHQPLRQCLGWVLLLAGRLDEAERAYKEDLARHPSNGWSLTGLKQVAAARGDAAAVEAADAQLRQAWAAAEVRPESSCPALAQPFSS